MRIGAKNYLLPITLFLAILVFWQIIVALGVISQFILPSPITVFFALVENSNAITLHSLQTLEETVIGMLLAIIFGLCTAIILDASSFVRKSLYPLLVTSQTIPMIAIAPLLLLWFGFGAVPKIIIVVLACFFPITVATVDGFAKTDKDFMKLFKSMDASYWQTLSMVRLPGALPQFFSGVKISATYAITAAIVGEYVGAYQGLGIYMQQMAHAHAIAVVFAIIFVIATLSLILFWAVVIIEKIAIPWHHPSTFAKE